MKRILLLVCILCVAISASAKKWRDGAYYDLAGVKHIGLISWDPPSDGLLAGKGDYIFYKLQKGADNEKLNQDVVKAFIMKNDSLQMDSFIVSSNKIFEKSPFLKVLLDGKIKIFKQTRSQFISDKYGGYSSLKEDYYYGIDDQNTTRLEKSNFIEIMSEILASKAYVVDRIKDKTFKLEKLEELLYFYRTDNYPESMSKPVNY